MSKNRNNYYLILLGLCYTLIIHLLTKFKEVKMIISSVSDYCEAARRRVPPFMLHYADGGSYADQTLVRNMSDLENIALRQRVHKRYV
jgi:L-lactate dehydrogenase (cytochrome)